MKSTRIADRLVVTTGSGRPWLAGIALAIAIAVAGFIGVGHVTAALEGGWMIGYLAIPLCGMVIFIMSKVLADIFHASLEIDPHRSSLLFEQRYLYRTVQDRFRFDEIDEFMLGESRDGSSSEYYIHFRTKDGRDISLCRTYSDPEPLAAILGDIRSTMTRSPEGHGRDEPLPS